MLGFRFRPKSKGPDGVPLDQTVGIFLVAFAALALLPVTNASGRPLDRSFGKDGRVEIKGALSSGDLLIAPTSEGGSVVAGLGQVVALNSSGGVNRRFGARGRAALPSKPGYEFDLSGLAVDPQQRIVVAGTFRPAAGTAVRPGTVVVARLLVNGHPDRSFGDGGQLESTFGLPTPPNAPLQPGEPVPPAEFTTASVQASGVAVDSKGRVILAGSYIARRQACRTYVSTVYAYDVSSGFAARLTGSGRLDPTFGDRGLAIAAASTQLSQPLIDAAGRITLTSDSAPISGCPERGFMATSSLAGLSSSGASRLGFDVRGAELLLFASDSAQDGTMRTLVLGSEVTGLASGVPEVVRALPSGALDRSFGDRGRLDPAEPAAGVLSAIGADPRGRVLVAGSEKGAFTLSRFSVDGGLDRSFGADGSVRTGLRGGEATVSDLAFDSRHRILVAGVVSRANRSFSLAVARYLPGQGKTTRR